MLMVEYVGGLPMNVTLLPVLYFLSFYNAHELLKAL